MMNQVWDKSEEYTQITIDQQTIKNIDIHQEKYDEYIQKSLPTKEDIQKLLIKVDGLEEIIKELREEKMSKKEARSLFRRVMDTTSYLNMIADNLYFLGKIGMPLYLYYRLSK